MAFEFARAFTDMHHTLPRLINVGNDFNLIVDNPANPGEPILHPDIDETVYTSWSMNGDGTGGPLKGNALTDLGIFCGFADRTQSNFGDGNFDFGASKRVSYLIMGRDPSTGEINPTWAMRSPSQGNQLIIDVTGGGFALNSFTHSPLAGGVFCNSDGLPVSVTLNGNTVFAVGWTRTEKNNGIIIRTIAPLSYPSSDQNTVFNNFFSFSNGLSRSTNRQRIIYDGESATYARLFEDNSMDGPFQTVSADNDVLFNNNLISALYGINADSQTVVGPLSDWDWDIFYRNRSDT